MQIKADEKSLASYDVESYRKMVKSLLSRLRM
jgi:hypothetical protein